MAGSGVEALQAASKECAAPAVCITPRRLHMPRSVEPDSAAVCRLQPTDEVPASTRRRLRNAAGYSRGGHPPPFGAPGYRLVLMGVPITTRRTHLP